MNENDIQMIESELAVRLPRNYTENMLNYQLSGTDNEGWELCNDANVIIGHNRELREHGFFDTEWPDWFFVIGSDGCGNYYFINLNESDPKVYLADHELPFDPVNLSILQETYPSIESYIRFLLEIDEESKQVKRQRNPKPWWKFWK